MTLCFMRHLHVPIKRRSLTPWQEGFRTFSQLSRMLERYLLDYLGSTSTGLRTVAAYTYASA